MSALEAGILYLDIVVTIGIVLLGYGLWLKYQQLKIEGKL